MNPLVLTLLLVLSAAFIQLPAQQNETERKRFEEIKAKAEKGDADAQSNLGDMYYEGRSVPKDEAEAMKWLRKAAEQGHAFAQFNLGVMYEFGRGVPKDEAEAAKWYRKAAEQGYAAAQHNLGLMYARGRGVPKDDAEAVKWYRKAVDQGRAEAQYNLGFMYDHGRGVPQNPGEAVKWFRKSAEQGHAEAQYGLCLIYQYGRGVPKDEAEAYGWVLLAGAQGHAEAIKNYAILERNLTPAQRAEGQRLAREFRPRASPAAASPDSHKRIAQLHPESTGTGFFITDDGYLITNEHVVKGAAQVRLVTSAGLITVRVVKVDATNDLALLKAEGRFAALPVVTSRAMRLGSTVATVGFPNVGLQGFAPKLAKGEIAALSGAQDDARYFQISVPVQPGNSGGALVEVRGNVVGVVAAKLSGRAALATSGQLPENVNYAVKSSFLLSFLESVPEVSAKLKEANTKERKFEDVVKSAEQAAVLVLVY